jgi:hypothetical protein
MGEKLWDRHALDFVYRLQLLTPAEIRCGQSAAVVFLVAEDAHMETEYNQDIAIALRDEMDRRFSAKGYAFICTLADAEFWIVEGHYRNDFTTVVQFLFRSKDVVHGEERISYDCLAQFPSRLYEIVEEMVQNYVRN